MVFNLFSKQLFNCFYFHKLIDLETFLRHFYYETMFFIARHRSDMFADSTKLDLLPPVKLVTNFELMGLSICIFYQNFTIFHQKLGCKSKLITLRSVANFGGPWNPTFVFFITRILSMVCDLSDYNHMV